ncbi:hypothetical protein BGW41_001160 [Actinomortierella wolfii]|nr:hypothetical protein BGW41_001160 [Actinomortierella wolfii]
MPNTRSPSPDTTGLGPSRCMAIAISTGQRCTRSGKYDGYCSEKHKQQAQATGNFWGHRADGSNPFSESEASESEKKAPATDAKKTKVTASAAKKPSSAAQATPEAPEATTAPVAAKTPRATKAKRATKPKTKRGGSKDDSDDNDDDDDDDDSSFTLDDSDTAPTPVAKAPATRARKTRATAAKKSTVATATKKKPAKARGKASQESEDEYIPSEESDSDFEPEDVVESSDDDYEDEDEDVDDLVQSLKTVKIQPDDPSLPPRPPGPKKQAGTKVRKSNIQRQGSKIFSTNKFLAPPKKVIEDANKEAGSDTTKPTAKHRGFWIIVPPKVDIPESTIKILTTVRQKLDRDDSFGGVSSGDTSSSSLSTSGFKYHTYVPKFLQPQADEDPDSKRAKFRQFAAKLWTKVRGVNDDSNADQEGQGKATTTATAAAGDEKDLPSVPGTNTEDSETGTKKKKSPDAGVKSSAASRQRRGSSASVDSVDSLSKDVMALTVRGDSGDEDVAAPNQCHGYNTNGQRCKRRVKVDGPIKKNVILLCHDHETNDEQAAVHIEGKGGVLLQWIDISSWVNPDLPDYIRVKLRRTMEKPISTGDKPGYIYAYHLKGASSDGTHTFFKVGRTDNVYRRMAQWSDQCGTPPRLLEVFPDQGSLAPRDDDDLDDDDEESAKKKGAGSDVVTGLRCRYAHRVEHLIHIELKPFHDKDHVCVCKTNHREWFKVPHKPGLSHSEQQKLAWQQVRQTIVHWMAYMEHVYGPG